MANVLVERVAAALALGLALHVRADGFDGRRELLEHVVDELDDAHLIELLADPENAQALAAVDRGEVAEAQA